MPWVRKEKYAAKLATYFWSIAPSTNIGVKNFVVLGFFEELLFPKKNHKLMPWVWKEKYAAKLARYFWSVAPSPNIGVVTIQLCNCMLLDFYFPEQKSYF